MSLSKVLIPVDFSEASKHTARYAIQFCNAIGATPTLFHVVSAAEQAAHGHLAPWRSPTDPNENMDLIEKELEHFMKTVEGGEGVAVKTLATREDTPEVICKQAQEANSDLIIMSTHSRSGMARFFMGSVAEHVIREAPCPVLTINQAIAERSSYRPIEKILHPTDFSDQSKKAASLSNELGFHLKAELRVLHVIDTVTLDWYHLSEAWNYEKMVAELKEQSLAQLDEYVQSSPMANAIGKKVELATGHIAKAVCDEIEKERIELVVLATNKRSNVERIFLGSVAERIIRAAKCPVLSVK